jgi:hypothetical protein
MRLYRGVGKNLGEEGPTAFYTTDPAKAALYGDVHYVDVTRDDMMHFAQGHNGPDEWVTDNKAIGRRLKPLASEPETPKAGTRAAPIKVETPEDVRAAEQHVDPDPTPAQAEAENYQHGHVTYEGMGVSLETAKGGTRKGIDANGKEWKVENYPAAYGRFKGTESTDGEPIDFFIGDKPPNGKLYVIHQHDPGDRQVRRAEGVRRRRQSRRGGAAVRQGLPGWRASGAHRQF